MFFKNSSDVKKIICPYHKETVPSCIIFDDNFECLGCGKKGSIKDLNEALKNKKWIKNARKVK